MSSRGHAGFLGMEYRAHSTTWIELALPWRDDLVGVPETGVLASGPIISLLDNACSMAVWIRRGEFRPQVTLDLRVDYVRAAAPGQAVVARCECYQVKRNVAFVRGLAHDGDLDDPVAHAAGTFMLMDAAR
ncbi:MAG TPA: PaaI family thioesterase [Novosphingobium sp.]|nr:PaaI family thioesterase [Novosphingobium sp.]